MADFIANGLVDGRLVKVNQGLVLPSGFDYKAYLSAIDAVHRLHTPYLNAINEAQPRIKKLRQGNRYLDANALEIEVQRQFPERESAIALLRQATSDGEIATRQYMSTLGKLLMKQSADQEFPFVFIERSGFGYLPDQNRQFAENIGEDSVGAYIIKPFVFAVDCYISRRNTNERSAGNNYMKKLENPESGEWIDPRVRSLQEITIMGSPEDTEAAADFRRILVKSSGLRIEEFAKQSPLW